MVRNNYLKRMSIILVLMLIMQSFTMPSYALQTKLTTPIGLIWDSTNPSLAKWATVSNASSYNVQLIKDGSNYGDAVTGVSSTSYDFSTTISAAGAGAYKFSVTAVGNGTSYSNSDAATVATSYDYTPDTVSTLSAISVDGVVLEDFEAETTSYSAILPYGTTQVPEVTATASSINATVSITQAAVVTGSATITVTAEDESTTIYTINFSVADPDTVSTLSSISVNGVALEDFDSETTSYSAILPYGTTQVPEVTATASSIKADVIITQAAVVTGSATITVTAEDESTTIYTINFSEAPLFGGRSGTQYDPYQISTPAELDQVRNYSNDIINRKYFILKNDIDLNVAPYNTGTGWVPIGNYGTGTTINFSGYFDGRGYVIKNLMINNPNATTAQALFAYPDGASTIINLGLENVDVIGKNNTGGLVGYNDGNIINCYTTGVVSSTGVQVGGLVGTHRFPGIISRSYSTATVTGSGKVGGFVGWSRGTIENSYSRGNVNGTNTDQNGGAAGGFVGHHQYGDIKSSYSTGAVTGTYKGSFIGKDDSPTTITNSYVDYDTSGVVSTGTTNVVTRTSIQMKDDQNYATNLAGFDFDTKWKFDDTNDEYPSLVWSIDITAPSLTSGAAIRTSDSAGTVKFTSDEAGRYYYTVVSSGAIQPDISTIGDGTACTTSETTITLNSLTAGAKDVYIVVKDAEWNESSYTFKINLAAFNSSPSLSSDAGLSKILSQNITAGLEAGTKVTPKTSSINVANSVSTVALTDVVKKDTGATVAFYGTDSTFTTTSGSISLAAGGATVVYVKVVAEDDTTLYYKVTINRAAANIIVQNNDSSDNEPFTGVGVEVIVNGKTENAATAITQWVDDKTVTTVTVDDKKVEEKLQKEGNNATVIIPVKGNSDVVVGQLNGQTVKNMETKEAVLEIKTDKASYTLPASQINIDSVSQQIGQQVQLKDIVVEVKISQPPQETVKVVENTASKNNYNIVVKPIDFDISCSSGGKTVEVSKFNGYVERTVAIPEGVDPSKITTGIVLNQDGIFSHVPTAITIIDGKYYAKINSLTNSTYSVIWNQKAFTDAQNHWAMDAINDMGSRLVISGVGNDAFEPDRDITRAEFAAIIVRALGLKVETNNTKFTDVESTMWYSGYINTAAEYNIISGYGNGKFGPMDKITREQAMVMVARAMKITKLNAELNSEEADKLLAQYIDAKESSDYAKQGIAECIKSKIITGKNNNSIAPQANMTRAEVATIISRLLKQSGLI